LTPPPPLALAGGWGGGGRGPPSQHPPTGAPPAGGGAGLPPPAAHRPGAAAPPARKQRGVDGAARLRWHDAAARGKDCRALAAAARWLPSYANNGRLTGRNSIVDTKTGLGHLRVTLSAVPPSKPVENFSLTPRWPITTRSAVRARSATSLATTPMLKTVSART